MSYRGGTIPKHLNKQTRKLLADLDEIAVRGNEKPSNTTVVVHSNPSPGNGPSQPSVVYTEDTSSGTITTIPIAPSGTHRSTRYKSNPTFKEGGNLKLAGPPFSPDPNQAVQWVSNGSEWLESNRGPGAETFVPARRYGAIPDTGADMTSKVQKAIDQCPAGCILVFEPGTYIVNGAIVTRNNQSICLPPGCIWTTNAQTGNGTLQVKGSVDTLNFISLVQSAGDVHYPRGGDRTIYVAVNDELLFPVDSWILIEDELAPGAGTWPIADTNMEFQFHCEMVRIRSRAPGVLNLYTPLVNSYTRTAATDPRIRTVTPIEGFQLWGGGTIKNPRDVGVNHGIYVYYALGAHFDNIRINDFFNSGINLARCMDTKVTNCTIENGRRFDDRGYGITQNTGIGNQYINNTFKRLRHCIDFEFFSRQCSAIGNRCLGSTTGNINTHASSEGILIEDNLVDGGFGQDAVANSVEYGDSTVQASGINVDVNCKNISIIGNTIRNMRLSGIYIDQAQNYPTEFVTIEGNTIENCVTYRRISASVTGIHAGIAAAENSLSGALARGIIIKGNTLRDAGGYGIIVGLDDAIVEGNWIWKAEEKRISTDTPVVGIGIWVKPAIGNPGIGIPADTHRVIVRGNTCSDCKRDGIRVGTDAGTNVISAIIENNNCLGNGNIGIFLEEESPHAVVRGNVCEANVLDGINTQSDFGLFENNKSVGNLGWGIRMIAGADDNTLRNNVFSGPGLVNNTLGEISNAGVGNFIVSHDRTNDRIGIGTNTPQQKLEVVGAERLSFSTAANDFTDLTHLDRTVFFGGLAVEPAINSTGLKWLHLFGQNDSSALSILDDGASFWIGRNKTGYDTFYGVAAGHAHRFMVNFSDAAQFGPTTNLMFFPTTFFFDQASRNTVGYPLTVSAAENNGLGTQIGFGSGITWALETATNGTFATAAAWENAWSNPTVGSLDSYTEFRVLQASVLKPVLRIDGAGQRVDIKRDDAATTGVVELLRLQRASSANTANTYGVYQSFFVDQGSSTSLEAGRFGVLYEDATNGGEDSGMFWRIQEASTLKELMRLRSPGGTQPELVIHSDNISIPQIRLFTDGSAIFNEQGSSVDFRVESNLLNEAIKVDGANDRVLVGQASGAEQFDVNLDIRARGIRLDGDTGAGVATTITHTNVNTAVSGATPATLGNTGGGPTGAAQSHWLKIYDGVTVRYIPVWT